MSFEWNERNVCILNIMSIIRPIEFLASYGLRPVNKKYALNLIK